jgi:hypothetical protein
VNDPKAGQVWKSKTRPDFKMVVVDVTKTEMTVDVDRLKNNVRETRRLVWPRELWRFHVAPYEPEAASGKSRKESHGKT